MTAFFTYNDDNDLLAAQLNGDNALSANTSLATLQTFAGPLSIAGITNTGVHIENARTVTASGTVALTATDYFVGINKTSGAATAVTLPTSPIKGQIVIIKDQKGDANTNNITVSGAVNIDGGATSVITTAYGRLSILYNGTTWSLI